MEVWLEGKKKGRNEDLKNGWLDGRTIDGRNKKELKDGWTDGRTDGWKEGWKEGKNN